MLRWNPRGPLESRSHALRWMWTTAVRRWWESTAAGADPVNLLTNAAKYTDPGGSITLRANCSDAEVEFSVIDNGIGIAPEALSDVFGMFAQVKSARERSDGGLGIGLALARGLAELHGGTIHARSDGPGPQRVHVRIPRHRPVGARAMESDANPRRRPQRAAC